MRTGIGFRFWAAVAALVIATGSMTAVSANAVDQPTLDLETRLALVNDPGAGLGGYGMDVDGDLAAAMGLRQSPNSGNINAIHVFERNAGTWSQTATISQPGTAEYPQTGLSPRLRGPVIIHNGDIYSTGQVLTTNSAYQVVLRYERDATGWGLAETIPLPSNSVTLNGFALLGDSLAMVTADGAGTSVYIRQRVNGTWTTTSWTPVAPTNQVEYAINSARTTLIVASTSSTTINPAVYPFTVGADNILRPANTIPLASIPQRVAVDNINRVAARTASTLTIYAAASGDYITSGTLTDARYANNDGLTSVGTDFYIERRATTTTPADFQKITRANGTWQPVAAVPSPSGQTNDQYASDLIGNGSTLLVGALAEDSSASGTNSGAVYIYNTVDGAPLPAAVTLASITTGDRSATITWLKPASEFPILGYTVTATPGGQTCTTDDADALTCTISGLTNGVNYTFTVVARTLVGDSPVDPGTGSGGGSTGTGTPGNPPAPPVVDPPVYNPGDGTEATLTWLAAATDPGNPVLYYTATATPGGQSCTTTGLTCTITGLNPTGDYSFTVVAYNANGPSGPGDVTSDRTAPTVSGTSDRPADATVNGLDWWDGPVTIIWTATDGMNGSGVATQPAPTTVTAEGIQIVTSPQVCDRAGNCATGQYAVAIDTTAPAITATPDRAPDATVDGGGWYTSAVNVTWTVTDAGAGFDGPAPAPDTFTANGSGQVATSGEVCDILGNCTIAETIVNLDTAAPMVTATPDRAPDVQIDGTGWYTGPVTVTFTAVDLETGLAAPTPAPVTITGDGAGQVVNSGPVCDRVGFCAAASATINVDLTAPEVSATLDRAPDTYLGYAGWYRSPVTITFTATDATTGVATTIPAPVVVSSNGADQVISSGQVCDYAGNCATAQVTVNYDGDSPIVIGTATTAANSNGWYNTPVTVTWAVDADTTSGIATPAPADTVIPGDGIDAYATGTDVCDNAGNCTTPRFGPVNIDTTAPAVTINGVTNGTTYQAGSVPTATCTASDTLSGLAAPCTLDTVDNGDATYSVTATVTDNADNTVTVTVTYTVNTNNNATCPVDPTGTVGATITIGTGQSCAIPSGAVITGKVTVTDGGTLTLDGGTLGALTINGGTVTLNGGTINGKTTISGDADVTLTGTDINAAFSASGINGGSLTLCGSTTNDALTVKNNVFSAPVIIGNPDLGCAANTITAPLTVANNSVTAAPNAGTAAVNIIGNALANTTVDDNRWSPSNVASAALIAGNTISGKLACASNVGPATNAGQMNTVSGQRTGQCTAL